jgi:hypothetical protein
MRFRLRKRRILAFSLVVTLGGLVFWAFWAQRCIPLKKSPLPVSAPESSARPTSYPTGKPDRSGDTVRSQLLEASRNLNSGLVPDSSRQLFADLRRALANLSPGSASAVIQEFLRSGANAPSHLDFKIGPDGFLAEPSSLRVFLLDYLGRVDPAAGAQCAERILSSVGDPDEWAVSLRNYALGNTNAEARIYLQQKVRAMIRYEPWQSTPSTGFLEAFDVAVYAGGAELVPDLADLLRRRDNQAVAHAAYLALDRLSLQDPAAVLSKLQGDPTLMAGRELTRANYFARANVEDVKQKLILEGYLLDSERSESELKTFAALFPSGNFMVSQNLLTRVSTPSGDAISRQDREALRVVNDWLEDPRFNRLRPRLQEMKSRLESFVAKPAKAN